MTFWEWTKSFLKIDKALVRITKTRPKLKTKHNISCNSCKIYYIQGERGRQSKVATKRLSSSNFIPYLIYITSANKTGNQARFDSDSFIIGVNNHASTTIYNKRLHFISDFYTLQHQHIKGISGQIAIKGRGTVIWNTEDYEGMVHTLDIKDTLYFPESPFSI